MPKPDDATLKDLANQRPEDFTKGLEMGYENEAQKLILRLGQKYQGKPSAATRKKVLAIRDLERLERILDRIVEAKGWSDVLATP